MCHSKASEIGWRATALTAARPGSMLTAVPSLFIDGEWVASTSGTCSQVVNPSDATVVTEVDVADDVDIAARDRRRAAGLRRDRLAVASRRRASRPAHAHGRAPRARPGRDRPRRDPQHRQGAPRERVRRRRRRQRLPLLRGARRQGGRPAGRHDRCERAEPHRLRAARRVRAHRPVELPAPADLLEGRARRWRPATRWSSSRHRPRR